VKKIGHAPNQEKQHERTKDNKNTVIIAGTAQGNIIFEKVFIIH
jgi:hypothetical protein